jgi:hypothetical protein
MQNTAQIRSGSIYGFCLKKIFNATPEKNPILEKRNISNSCDSTRHHGFQKKILFGKLTKGHPR